MQFQSRKLPKGGCNCVGGVFRIYFHTLRGTLRERVSGENEISLETLSLLRKRFCPCYANSGADIVIFENRFARKLKFSSAKKLFERKRRLLSFVQNGHLIQKMLFHSIRTYYFFRTTSKNLLCFDASIIISVACCYELRRARATTSGLKGRLFDENWQRRGWGGRPRNAETRVTFYREHVGACLILCDFLSTPRNIDNARRCCFTSRFHPPTRRSRDGLYQVIGV